MAVSHRTNRLKVIGNPSVEQLQNGRYRLTFDMQPLNPRNDWYNANKSRIFADFGTLESAEMSVDGIPPRTGEAYDNMRLVSVEAGNRSRVEGGDYIVQFVYETLGDTFVQVKDDTIDYELNGLRRVTRESIAKAGVDFQKTVGTTTITSQIDTESPVTLYLADYEIDETDSYRRVEEVYIEAGTLSKDVRTVGDGVRQTTQVDLVIAPTVAAGNYTISQDIDNFQGLKRFTTSFISKSDGTTLTESDGGEKLAFEYEKLVPFTFPGVVNVRQRGGGVFTELEAPVEATVKADVYTYYQTSNDIVAGDFTKESALGLWNPSSWAKKTAFISAFIENGRIQPAYHNSQALRGYRVRNSLTISGDTGVPTRRAEMQIESDRAKVVETIIQDAYLEEVGTVNGKPAYESQPFDYVYDTGKYQIQQWSSGGPLSGTWLSTSTKSYYIKGKVTIRVEYSGTRWEVQYKDIVTRNDPDTFTSNGTDTTYRILNSAYSNAAAGEESYQSTYTRPGDLNVSTFTTVKQAALGSESLPSDATWDDDLVVEAPSQEESESISTTGPFSINNQGVRSFTASVEGRRVGFSSSGSLTVAGGPPDPLNKKYTLDVNIKKAFTDKDGTDVFQKQIVIATCTAV